MNRKGKLLWLLLCLMAAVTPALAQQYQLSGRIKDVADTSGLPGVLVNIIDASDTSIHQRAVTDIDGRFLFGNLANGNYRITAAYASYKDATKNVSISKADASVNLELESLNRQLSNVTVKGVQVRGVQNGDTSQFNSDAFKTNPDATAEDLVKKMPGITTDAEGIKVNGEVVKKVLVDGKPFFGDDPSASLKNLPAEVIDKVQFYDQKSDQSRFSGFDDGNNEKTINLTTHSGKNRGQFGKAFAGYGTDGRYNAGGNLNIFNGVQRISVLGMLNNINQQNFAIDDVMSMMSNSGSKGGGPGSGGPGGGGNGGGPGNFFAGQQNGITKTSALGLNYTDAWGKKIAVTGSYFFNRTNSLAESDLTRSFYSADGLQYRQNSSTTTINQNHRVNFRMEYTIDSMNMLTITPRLSLQKNESDASLSGNNSIAGILSSLSSSKSLSDNTGYNLSNNILFQHRFGKKGRSISFNLGTTVNNRDGDGSYYSSTEFAGDSIASILDQEYTLTNRSTTISGNVTYTEPLGKKSQLMLSYNPSVTTSKADKETSGLNGSNGTYTDLDTLLSNKYESRYITQRAGLGYRYNSGKVSFNAGLDGQQATLDGTQAFPVAFNINRSFTNLLPNAMLSYKISKSENLNINYRSSTNAPSITQLQNVVDISNPLQLKSGNADLNQTFENRLMMRYGRTNSKTSRNFFGFLMGTYTKDYISSATYTPTTDTLIDGYTVARGSQLTRPVNLDGYWNVRANGVYSLPLNFIKSNLNLNGGISYTRDPALLNNQLNYAGNAAPNAGFYLGSNISQSVDFSVSYNGSYNMVKNTLPSVANTSYYSHTAMAKLNWMPWKGLVVNSDVTHTQYSGLGEGYDQSFFLWNAYVGYKLLKDRSLEAKISVFDILNQNRSVARTISETYYEDTRSNVLQRYGMFTLTWTIRNFKNGSAPEDGMKPPAGMPAGGPPPGMMRMGPPPGGG